MEKKKNLKLNNLEMTTIDVLVSFIITLGLSLEF